MAARESMSLLAKTRVFVTLVFGSSTILCTWAPWPEMPTWIRDVVVTLLMLSTILLVSISIRERRDDKPRVWSDAGWCERVVLISVLVSGLGYLLIQIY